MTQCSLTRVGETGWGNPELPHNFWAITQVVGGMACSMMRTEVQFPGLVRSITSIKGPVVLFPPMNQGLKDPAHPAKSTGQELTQLFTSRQEVATM